MQRWNEETFILVTLTLLQLMKSKCVIMTVTYILMKNHFIIECSLLLVILAQCVLRHCVFPNWELLSLFILTHVWRVLLVCLSFGCQMNCLTKIHVGAADCMETFDYWLMIVNNRQNEVGCSTIVSALVPSSAVKSWLQLNYNNHVKTWSHTQNAHVLCTLFDLFTGTYYLKWFSQTVLEVVLRVNVRFSHCY